MPCIPDTLCRYLRIPFSSRSQLGHKCSTASGFHRCSFFPSRKSFVTPSPTLQFSLVPYPTLELRPLSPSYSPGLPLTRRSSAVIRYFYLNKRAAETHTDLALPSQASSKRRHIYIYKETNKTQPNILKLR
jgi:hypothetical protein